jgi:hypothetical protein
VRSVVDAETVYAALMESFGEQITIFVGMHSSTLTA